jgi:hypothetical protein
LSLCGTDGVNNLWDRLLGASSAERPVPACLTRLCNQDVRDVDHRNSLLHSLNLDNQSQVWI